MATRKTASASLSKAKTKNIAFAELLEPTHNPWTEVPKFKSSVRQQEDFKKSVDHCRFFYRTEPLVSTVLDKLVEIGINDIVFSKNKLSENEYRVFKSLKPRLLEFAEQMATEYLLSGLVVPEIGYNTVDKDFVFSLGVKKITSLELPDSMWVRDPVTIKIQTSMLSDKPSYFAKIPEGLITFIKSKGVYADGKKDVELYKILIEEFEDFVKAVLKGETEILLEDSLAFRRKYTSDNQYPIPYANSALEALHHKRKLRRMDYSIIDKVISAIMHVKVGDKDFPITETKEDEEYLNNIREQLRMRGKNEQVLERIFQLITNHTVAIEWIFPNTEALLNVDKYKDINQEILFGLGFPRVLITGEAEKSGTSDSEIATLSPLKTAENFRRKILEVLRNICLEVSKRNGFSSVPDVTFKAINLHKFNDFINGLKGLYDISGLSRTSIAEEFGYDFDVEAVLLEKEMNSLREKGLSEFGPTPNSKTSVLLEGDQPSKDGETKPKKKPKEAPTSGQSE